MKANEPCEVRRWDSDFFGLKMAHVVGDTIDHAKADAIEEWCEEHDVRFLSFLASIDSIDSTWIAEDRGFHLVDFRVTFERSLSQVEPSTTLRALDAAEFEALSQTARGAHDDSRFFQDPGFSDEKCSELYETWLRKSIEGQFDDVALTVAGDADGYVTCRFRNGVGSIGLIAVGEHARGRGVGHQLVEGAMREAAAAGCESMEVVTQGRNIHAQRLYQSHGFRTKSIAAWYHRWFNFG